MEKKWKKLNYFKKILYFLGVYQVFSEKLVSNGPSWEYRYERFNPWNPITYVLIIPYYIIVGLFQGLGHGLLNIYYALKKKRK